MIEGAWSRFLEYAAHARTKPSFDVEERLWKLEVAGQIREALAAGGADDERLDRLIEALKRHRPPFLTSNGHRRWLRAWAATDRASLLRGLGVFSDPSLDPVERVARFDRAASEFEPDAQRWNMAPEQLRDASVAVFGPLFNFAAAPASLPPVRTFHRLAELLGASWDVGDGSPAFRYRAQLDFAEEVRSRLKAHGVPIRDMIDVQSLIAIGVQEARLWTADPPAGWEERGRRLLPPSTSYLTVCALYQNEARDLREWIEFHRAVGVERFILYDNLSTDQHLDVLATYIEQGTVVRHEWPGFPPVQGEVYSDCLRRHRDDARWIAFIDVDEFLFSPTGRDLREMLRDYERWPGVAVNLVSFSYSGHRTRPSGLVIENYPFRETRDPGLIKQIVDPLRTLRSDSPHWYEFEYGLPIDENHWPIGTGWTKSTSLERLRINHYGSKSEEEAREKARRYAGWNHLARWRLSDLSGEIELVRDDSIDRWVPPVKQALARSRTSA